LRAGDRPPTLTDVVGERGRRARDRTVAVGLLWLALSWALVGDEAAAGPARVVRHGACSGPSAWRLRVLADDAGVLRVRFSLAGGSPGQSWNVYMDRDGVGFFAGSRVSGEDGALRVRRRIPDLPGRDVIRAAGHNTATGELCRGRVRI
jgi:hypothetical protein